MKIEIDSRINIGFIGIRHLLLMFLGFGAISGFHTWIFINLSQKGMLENNIWYSIRVLEIYIFISVGLFIASIGAFFLYKYGKPLKTMSNAARRIVDGDFSIRIPPSRKDEKKDFMGVLFDDFNSMTEELEYMKNNLQNLVNEKTEKVIKLQNAILTTMSDLVEFRDDITGEHIERTKDGVKILLDEIKRQGLFPEIINNWNINLIIQSVQLHDIGKIGISDQILKKPGSLTKEEFDEMKKHSIIGYNIIERIEKDSGENELLNYAKIFALNHHEKWDGTGYPNGLKGNKIPLEGRIMAIIDVYDALVSERPYKTAFSHEEAIKIITEGKHTQFDPILTDIFLSIKDKFN